MCAVEGAGGSTASSRSAARAPRDPAARSCGSGGGRERRRPETEEAVPARPQPLGEPARRLLGVAVLGEPPGELLGRLLGLELRELGVLAREQPARLQLEQRGDQHQELAAGVEVELLPLGEPLDERDHDLRQVDLGERQLLPQDERQQQVERPLERIEVEVEPADQGRRRHAAQASRASGRGPSGWPSSALRDRRGLRSPGAARCRAAARPRTSTRRRRRSRTTKQTIETQAFRRRPAIVVRRVDPQQLLEEPPEAVVGDVERKERRRTEAVAAASQSSSTTPARSQISS